MLLYRLPEHANILVVLSASVIGVFGGLSAIVMGMVVLAGKRLGNGPAIVGITTGILAVALTVADPWPIANHSRTTPPRIICASHLSGTGKALALYMADNGHVMPPNLRDLVVKDWNLRLDCPSGKGADRYSDYFYRPAPADAPEDTIIACDYRDNHATGRNVLFAHLHVQWLAEQYFQVKLNQPHNAAFATALREVEGL